MSVRALGPRQFQDTLPGMEHLAPPPATPEPNRYSRQGRTPLPGGYKPAGMRGSVPDRAGLEGRVARQAQGHQRWESMRTRMEDERFDPDEDLDELDQPIPAHPRTGLPAYGEIRTITPSHPDPGLGDIHSIGMRSGSVPRPLSFHESSPSARNSVGKLEWIPVPGMQTVQSTVSSQRVHQALESPETTQNPRIPRSIRPDVPHVYASQDHDHMGALKGERFTVIDGNHRMSAHILSGRLFAEARVLRDKDIPGVTMKSKQVREAKSRAESGQADRGVTEEVEGRMNDRVYGTGQW